MFGERELEAFWRDVAARQKLPSADNLIAYSRDLEAMARDAAVAAMLMWLNVAALRIHAEKSEKS